MKKKIKIFLLLLTIFFLSSCTNFNATLDIKEDKSGKLSFSFLSDKEINKQLLKNKSLFIKETEVDNLKEYEISKVFDDINKITYPNKFDIKINSINDLLYTDFNYIFYRNKKGNYEGNYIINTKDETTFTLKLPYKSLRNNATTTEDNGKTLIWQLDSDHNNIFFEFNLLGRNYDIMGLYSIHKTLVNFIVIYLVISIFILSVVINTLKISKEKKKSVEKSDEQVIGLKSHTIGNIDNQNNN